VRSHEHAAVAVCGRFAIAGVVRQDLRAAIAALAGRSPQSRAPAAAIEDTPGQALEDAPPDALEDAAAGLIAAFRRGSEA